jgi:hypothetical protein
VQNPSLRKQAVLRADEMTRPRRWHYLSFINSQGFLGAAIVRAHGKYTAIERTRELGICPLGPDAYIPNDVAGCALSWRDMQRIPGDLRDRLLTRDEVIERLEGKGATE